VSAPDPVEDRVDLRNEADVERWAHRLCTSPAELRRAVEAVGPGVEAVKRYLLVSLVRQAGKPAGGR
jgi:hypothetical protein